MKITCKQSGTNETTFISEDFSVSYHIPDFSCKISISFLHCVVYLAKVWMMNACRAHCEKEITKLLRCFFGFITGTLVQGIFFFVRSCIFHSAY